MCCVSYQRCVGPSSRWDISVVDYSGMLILYHMTKNVALSNDKHWQSVTHIRPDNNNEATSGERGACTASHLPVLKECFRRVKPFSILKWSTGSLRKLDLDFGCLGLLARMNTVFFIFHLVILAGKNTFKTKLNVCWLHVEIYVSALLELLLVFEV